MTREWPWQHALKRTIDYGSAAVGLTSGAPLLAALVLAIRWESPGPAIFRQVRIGRMGRPFVLYKFRSMASGALPKFNPDRSMVVTSGDDRLTRIGRIIRGGIDELPQLVNILKGEMSLVGPRPELAIHMAQYTSAQMRRLDVLPGITGLPAVLGRNNIPWPERLQLDTVYVDNWSLSLDLRIIAQTILGPIFGQVFKFDDIISANSS